MEIPYTLIGGDAIAATTRLTGFAARHAWPEAIGAVPEENRVLWVLGEDRVTLYFRTLEPLRVGNG